ncbi:MAG TPA: hypothetical protein VLW53_02790, partial [Candidatus Eisenbacteria bacterium]|nr:hypothetical protein [Candidatus Eisenbacteria bacterium]
MTPGARPAGGHEGVTPPDGAGLPAPDGIDGPRVTAWLLDNVAGVEAPFQFERIAGGRSNLTFVVTDAGARRLVLRRPPLS